ncbi:helicase [Plantactinospora sp. BB1]|nr:helicase [Plantactinospora sp. BB1]
MTAADRRAPRARHGRDWNWSGRGRRRSTVQRPPDRGSRPLSRCGGFDARRPAGRGCQPVSRCGGSDRGSATLWLLAVGLVLVVLSLGAAAIGAARVARHQARVAADLGALAGATQVLAGPDRACARATAIAAANSARVTGCTLDGLDLLVTAEVTVEPLPGMTRVASATARAGPVRGEQTGPTDT